MEDEESEEVQEILEIPEDSAGRLMSADIVAVRETSTVEEAIQRVGQNRDGGAPVRRVRG